jgi:pimeloyl-ACP methyl ester carboxylesterase
MRKNFRLLVVFKVLIIPLLIVYSLLGASAFASDGKYIKIGDISMYVEQHGKGEPVIFLHGGMGSANSWAYQVPVFSKIYRVITLDSRGQGRTSDSAAPLSYHLMAEDVVRLMDVLKIPSAYIVGWSDGGNIGIDLAIHHPTRIKGVVAYGANINPAGLQNHFLNYLRTATPEEMQRDNGSDFLALSAHPEHLPVIAEKIRNMWLNEPNFTQAQLSSIKAPTLIVDGAEEELIRREHAKEIAAAIPNAKLVMLPNVGHYAIFKKPELWNKTVLEFLKRDGKAK